MSGDISHMLLLYSTLPRVAVALLGGAALGLSGALFQAVLRNPLAEPTTLGTSAGAQLAVTLAALWLPGLGREGPALAGAALATGLSCALAWRDGLSPLPLILAGLVIALFCGAAAAMLGLLHYEQLAGVFVWGTGSLVQYDWRAAISLAPRLLLAGCGAALLARPLGLLALDDESARSLGVPLRGLRFAALAIGVMLSASVVSAVGVIGFVGLVGPALARALGARRLRALLAGSALAGSVLLGLADRLVLASGWAAVLPTGTATALLGAPLLLGLLPWLRDTVAQPAPGRAPATHPWRRIGGLAVLLALALLLALDCGRGPSGWGFDPPGLLAVLMRWRWPRVLAALSAGAMLAQAGAMLQRVTGNPMASPEMLGVSSGAAMGVIVLLLAGVPPTRGAQLAGAAAGAVAVLAALLLLGCRSGFSPQRLLLAGVALTTLFSAAAALLMASGDPRMQMLVGWMSGSTYQTTGADAVAAAIACVVLLAAVPLLLRMLAVLPLGAGPALALGLPPARGRAAVLLATALLTAVATLVVGPLTFVGLMGPHLARLLGLRRALLQLAGAALLGALIMVVADWLGRNLLFPYQIPAGLLASLVGSPFLLWSMRRPG
jgi:ABC-type Fe3+-siderophore transport system permease subunit